jgi:PadR family transcriptional regulator, regulatory protein AphA
MSLKHALLGFLSYRPMTGYELKQFFDATVQHFWNAELSQIYPTLRSLEEGGYVDKHVEVQENRPNRKVYELTEAGHDEFVRWVRQAPEAANLRDPFLIKVFFGTEVPAEEILIQLRRQMEEQQKMLAFSETVLRGRIDQAVEKDYTHRHRLYWTLTLELAVAYRRAYIDWCQRAMAMLDEIVSDEVLEVDREPEARGASAAG